MIKPLINLIAGDVDRPLADIALRVTDPDLFGDARTVLETAAPVAREVRDDQNHWWLRRIVPYRSTEQRIDGVVITYTDIDAIKVAAAQAQRLDLVLLNSNDAVIVRNLQGGITAWNRAASQITGYSEAEVLGLDLTAFIPDALRAQEKERFTRVARGEHPPSWETQRITKDGRVIDVWVTATTLLDEQGLPVAVLTTTRDITERKRSEEQLRALNTNLEQLVARRTQELEQANERLRHEIREHRRTSTEVRHLNESLEERVALRTRELTDSYQNLEKFSYSIAHDLRAPLRAIHGFASILVDSLRGQATAEQTQCIERITSNSARMGELIDDILAFSQLSRVSMEMRPVSMEAMVKQTVAQIGNRYPSAAVKVGGLPPAYADPALMRCVLENLLTNALKFSSGREHPLVEVGAEEGADGKTIYFVRDNGAGFDMADAAHLFEPFTRLHDAAAYPGTGVGLAIVKTVVERHGGCVWGQSAPDKGAKFSFTLAQPKTGLELPGQGSPASA